MLARIFVVPVILVLPFVLPACGQLPIVGVDEVVTGTVNVQGFTVLTLFVTTI